MTSVSGTGMLAVSASMARRVDDASGPAALMFPAAAAARCGRSPRVRSGGGAQLDPGGLRIELVFPHVQGAGRPQDRDPAGRAGRPHGQGRTAQLLPVQCTARLPGQILDSLPPLRVARQPADGEHPEVFGGQQVHGLAGAVGLDQARILPGRRLAPFYPGVHAQKRIPGSSVLEPDIRASTYEPAARRLQRLLTTRR